VFTDYNYGRRELEGIFLTEAAADAYLNYKNNYNLLVKEEWAIDDKPLFGSAD
jgi:hypothetical protein